MKAVSVKASELGDRWDAGFHVAAAGLRDRVARLREELTEEEAAERVSRFPMADRKEALAVLARGASKLDADGVGRVVGEYPHLSLALAEERLEPAIMRLRAEIAGKAEVLDRLLSMVEPSPAGPRP